MAAFGCRLSVPRHDLGDKEKDEIAKGYSVSNTHERDALSSALRAHALLAGKFARIDQNLESLGLDKLSDMVKELLITGRAKNISEAIEKLTQPERVDENGEETKEERINWKAITEKMRAKLNAMQKSYSILKDYSEKLEQRVVLLEKQRKEFMQEERQKSDVARRYVLREHEIATRDMAIKHLEQQVKKQHTALEWAEAQVDREIEFKQIEEEEGVAIVPIDDWTKDAILAANKEFGIADKAVWIKNYRESNAAAKTLVQLSPKAAIFEMPPAEAEMLRSFAITVIVGIDPEQHKYWAVLPKEKFLKALREAGQKGFLDWLGSYRKR